MSGQSLGLIETVGLTVAVEAADAAMKSANVGLIGYELTKGGGLVTVKFSGEVGAMNAAVAAGVAAASRVGSVYAWKIIARTATSIDSLIASTETCGIAPDPVAAAATVLPPAAEQKAVAIPVVNVEPDMTAASCGELSDSVCAEAPLSGESATQASESPQRSEQGDETENGGDRIISTPAEKAAPKPARPRPKSPRR
ncbi:BMC domain-containing protein [Klebsiella sp. NPDC088457]